MTGGTAPSQAPLVVDGWSIHAHPIFLDRLDALIEQVEASRVRTRGLRDENCTKRLSAIFELATGNIPGDSTFRQGDTIGDHRKHWFRVKFFQRYRFYRFENTAKVIVLAWVNDEQTLRAQGNGNDAYATFRRMLNNGNPPDNFAVLMNEATAKRFEKCLGTAPRPYGSSSLLARGRGVRPRPSGLPPVPVCRNFQPACEAGHGMPLFSGFARRSRRAHHSGDPATRRARHVNEGVACGVLGPKRLMRTVPDGGSFRYGECPARAHLPARRRIANRRRRPKPLQG